MLAGYFFREGPPDLIKIWLSRNARHSIAHNYFPVVSYGFCRLVFGGYTICLGVMGAALIV